MSFNMAFIYCIAGILGLFGLFLGIMGIITIISGGKQKKWPAGNGRVLASRLEEKREEVRADEGTSTLVGFAPLVEYEYIHKGERYTASTLSSAEKQYARAQAQKVIDRYPIGSTVKVYVNPDSPVVTVLEPGGSISGMIFLIIGLAFIAAAILISLNVAPQ
jgi:hypothetical protein